MINKEEKEAIEAEAKWKTEVSLGIIHIKEKLEAIETVNAQVWTNKEEISTLKTKQGLVQWIGGIGFVVLIGNFVRKLFFPP